MSTPRKTPDATSTANPLHTLFSWVTPLLVAGIAYFAKNKLDSIDAKLDTLTSLQVRMGVMETKQANDENELDNHSTQLTAITEHYQLKKEDEPTVQKK